MELKCADQQKQTATMKRDLASAKKRLADLDMKLKRTYEDNMSGKLPDHIFTMFIADYDTERAMRPLGVTAGKLAGRAGR